MALIEAWVFVIMLNMPSFGGPVDIRITATTEQSCKDLRKLAVNMAGGEKNIKGTVTDCEERK